MSKTDGILLPMMFWKLDTRPGPVLFVGPTRDMVMTISKERVATAIRQSPSLLAALKGGKSDTIMEKFINGCRLGFAWCGSETAISAHAVCLLLVDELDRIQALAGKGNPLGIARARMATYRASGEATEVITSSPLVGNIGTVTLATGLTHWAVAEINDVSSPVWKLWQQGTRHEWAWRCAQEKCSEYFIPRRDLLVYDTAADTAEAASKDVGVACPHCGTVLREHGSYGKLWMNAHGVMVAPGQAISKDGAVIGDETPNRRASGWASGLCSPWVSWADVVYQLHNALTDDDSAELQPVINTLFGECYAQQGARIEVNDLDHLRGDYLLGETPQEVSVLTLGVDIGDNNIWAVLRGWGPRYESWMIQRWEIRKGPTGTPVENPAPWDELGRIIDTPWDGLLIERVCIDARHLKLAVYAFCRERAEICVPTNGGSTLTRGWKEAALEETPDRKPDSQGMHLLTFGVHERKKYIRDHIKPGDDSAAGETASKHWHIPGDADPEYVKHLVSEELIRHPNGKLEWRKRSANHMWDCEVLCRVAIEHFQNGLPIGDREPAQAAQVAGWHEW